jgi:hypothetical protein
VVVIADTPLWIAGIGIMLAVPLTFMVANWVRKNVDHGEMRFGPDGKAISEREAASSETIRPAQRIEDTGKAGDEQ